METALAAEAVSVMVASRRKRIHVGVAPSAIKEVRFKLTF